MSKQLMMIAGMDGQIELLEDRVIIHRRGILNLLRHGFHARREIPISSISSVHFMEANFFKMGEIDFDHAGRSQVKSEQNKVKFAKKHQKAFLALKEKVFEIMNTHGQKK